MLSDFKLYRWWKGGKWYYLKAKNTPPMNMFTWWTRKPNLYSDTTILHAENYKDRPGRKIMKEINE